MVRRYALAVVFALSAVVLPAATTYKAITFDELVGRAAVIFIGEVIDVRPYRLDTRDGTIIKTRVVFRVQDPIFGTTSTLEVLEFLGGEVGDLGMAVAGMPRFTIGDRRVVFATRERTINPIVGFTQGLLQIRRDANGLDHVRTLDGAPVVGAQSFGARLPLLGNVPATPVRLSDFRDQIRRALLAHGR